MKPLLFILPAFSIYLVIRALMHRKAGRPRWCIHYLFMAGFMMSLFVYEVWMHLQTEP